MKPLFNEKGSGFSNEIVLLEKDEILRDYNEVAKELHSYFNSIASSLGMPEIKYTNQKNVPSSEPTNWIQVIAFHSQKSKLMMLIKKYVP